MLAFNLVYRLEDNSFTLVSKTSHGVTWYFNNNCPHSKAYFYQQNIFLIRVHIYNCELYIYKPWFFKYLKEYPKIFRAPLWPSFTNKFWN